MLDRIENYIFDKFLYIIDFLFCNFIIKLFVFVKRLYYKNDKSDRINGKI